MIAEALSLVADASATHKGGASVPVDRQRLLAAMIELCHVGHGQASDEARALIDDIFIDLVKRAERDLRLRLAEQLADAPWAPSALINALALDDIEIARPVISKSPVLKDHDLITILVSATIDHQIEVARRPGLGEAVVAAILDRGDPVVLITLAGNDAAELSETAMTRLVEFSRQIAALRTPLSRHPKLNLELAHLLYSWVGEALRDEILGRFKVERRAFDSALRQATAEALGGAPLPIRPEPDAEAMQRDMETRLVAKLQAAGELRSGFLLRALREGKLHLFQVALACLASVRTEAVRAACDSEHPELLALACAGVGVDRSVFPTVLSLVRALNRAHPKARADTLIKINAAFTLKAPGEAINAFVRGVAVL
jgi:uncharacterized protein (DUF2336 family)